MSRKVTNTSQTEVNPQWVMGGNPNAIEAQEARGQEELVNSDQLPVDVRGDKASLPIELGPPSSNDPLFCRATLPDGWSKRPTDHAMWSELVDDKGVVRAMIFYKAAFYDRSAHMTIK